jgi:hypothetical protein
LRLPDGIAAAPVELLRAMASRRAMAHSQHSSTLPAYKTKQHLLLSQSELCSSWGEQEHEVAEHIWNNKTNKAGLYL